jgi:hypothetical protein
LSKLSEHEKQKVKNWVLHFSQPSSLTLTSSRFCFKRYYSRWLQPNILKWIHG